MNCRLHLGTQREAAFQQIVHGGGDLDPWRLVEHHVLILIDYDTLLCPQALPVAVTKSALTGQLPR